MMEMEMEKQPMSGPSAAVSEHHVSGRRDDLAVKAAPVERQSVEVRPMRYVLGLGIVLSALGLAVVYFLM